MTGKFKIIILGILILFISSVAQVNNLNSQDDQASLLLDLK